MTDNNLNILGARAAVLRARIKQADLGLAQALLIGGLGGTAVGGGLYGLNKWLNRKKIPLPPSPEDSDEASLMQQLSPQQPQVQQRRAATTTREQLRRSIADRMKSLTGSAFGRFHRTFGG